MSEDKKEEKQYKLPEYLREAKKRYYNKNKKKVLETNKIHKKTHYERLKLDESKNEELKKKRREYMREYRKKKKMEESKN